MQLNKLIVELSEHLKLSVPIIIIIKTERAPDEPQAEYAPIYCEGTAQLLEHEITIWLNDIKAQGRSFNTILAHELIHAWQEERRLTEIHGFTFRNKAAELEKAFPKLTGIYMREIDEE